MSSFIRLCRSVCLLVFVARRRFRRGEGRTDLPMLLAGAMLLAVLVIYGFMHFA